jgi:predicted membrane chloride channel (bestrophin family)
MKTDRLEFWVRFVCGALFGLLLGLYFAFNLLEGPFVLALGITLGISLGFGMAAVRYGDRFWERILPILRSWLMWS